VLALAGVGVRADGGFPRFEDADANFFIPRTSIPADFAMGLTGEGLPPERSPACAIRSLIAYATMAIKNWKVTGSIGGQQMLSWVAPFPSLYSDGIMREFGAMNFWAQRGERCRLEQTVVLPKHCRSSEELPTIPTWNSKTSIARTVPHG